MTAYQASVLAYTWIVVIGATLMGKCLAHEAGHRIETVYRRHQHRRQFQAALAARGTTPTTPRHRWPEPLTVPTMTPAGVVTREA